MKCPVDQAVLEISNRNNIEIDYCPTCRGVWLDRGELDKIIERSDTGNESESRQQPTQYREEPRYEAPRREASARYSDDDHHYQKPKKKRESFLGDLFDF